jgi:hypothetical protein
VLWINTAGLRSLVLVVAELNHFPYRPNKDRLRWKEMVLWVHETTPTIKSEAATCWMKPRAAGFSKDREWVNSSICVKERLKIKLMLLETVCIVDQTALKTLKNRNVIWRNETSAELVNLRWEDVSALLATVHLLGWYTKRQEHAKTSNVGHRQDPFLFVCFFFFIQFRESSCQQRI